MTVLLSLTAFAGGACLGAAGAWAKLAGPRWLRAVAGAYTTVMRGVPDLLVIYLFYFGGSSVLTGVGRLMGQDGFIGLPGFAAGAAAVAFISGAYQTEVFRGAVGAVAPDQMEAGLALGLSRRVVAWRVMAPQVLRAALPGLGNVWQVVVKESALVSVTGLIELLPQVNLAAGSTRQPFLFYAAGAALYLVITTASGQAFRVAERRAGPGVIDGAFLLDTMRRLLAGLPLTLSLAAISVGVGMVLAVLLTVARRTSHAAGWAVDAYVYVLRGSPLLVQLFLIYYGLSQFPEIR